MENIAKALVKAQAKLHNLGKNAKAYNYDYLTLDKLIEETRTVLAECGLVIVQPMTIKDGVPVVRTILLHDSGESIEGEYPISAVSGTKINEAQAMGSAITYARRYCLAAMLNIAQADDDGQAVGQTQEQPKAQAKPAATAQAPTKADAEKCVNGAREKFRARWSDDIELWCQGTIEAGQYQEVMDYCTRR